MQCFRHVHDLCAEGRHAGAAADPDHLLLGVENRVEVAIGAAHRDLVAGLKGEDVRRSDARHDVLETDGGFWLERRRRYAHGEHDAVAFGRVVRHGVGAHRLFRVLALQVEETELLPGGEVLFANRSLVDVLVVVDGECRNLDLRVRAGDEVHVLALGELDDELLDERGDVFVRNDFALPFLDAEYGFGYRYGEVAFHLALAAQAVVFFYLFAREVALLDVEDFAAAFRYLAFALAAGALAAAGRRE